jgi:hypothetical protein
MNFLRLPRISIGSALSLATACLSLACGVEPVDGDNRPQVDQTVQQALRIQGEGGYALVTNASTVDSSRSWNTSGAANTVSRLSTGRFRVDFPNLGGRHGGNVQAVSVGSGTERCGVSSWFRSGTTLQVFVNCNSRTGSPADTGFAVSFVARTDVTGPEGGYAWANQASAPLRQPYFDVTIPQLSVSGSNVHVTADWQSAADRNTKAPS